MYQYSQTYTRPKKVSHNSTLRRPPQHLEVIVDYTTTKHDKPNILSDTYYDVDVLRYLAASHKRKRCGRCGLDLNLSITDGIVSSKIYDKRDDFNLEIVNFPFLDGDVPRSPSYGVYISQLIRFARVCSNVEDFNNRNIFLLLNY